MKLAEHVARRAMGGVHTVFLLGRPESQRLFGRSMFKWDDNIKVIVEEMGLRAWTGLMWLRMGASGWLF